MDLFKKNKNADDGKDDKEGKAKKFTAVNTIKRNGKYYFPGADIELAPKSKETQRLLDAKAIKNYDPDYGKAYHDGRKPPANHGEDDFTEINGIGPEMAYTLKNIGINNFLALANTQAEQLAKLPGITEKNAAVYRAEAKRILSRRKK